MMAKSYRHVMGGVHGRICETFTAPGGEIISAQSVVHVSAGQVDVHEAGPDDMMFGPDAGKLMTQPFTYTVGDADVWVSNVSPLALGDNPAGGSGGVAYVLHVDSPSPIDVAVTITIEDQTVWAIGRG
jgi:hypothetical protein